MAAKIEKTIEATDYKHLTAEMMEEYMKTVKPDEIGEYMKNAYKFFDSEVKKDADGNPIVIKEHLSKSGKPIPAKYKHILVPITDSKKIKKLLDKGEKPRYDMFNAKQWFCGKYYPDKLPKQEKPERENKTDNFFEEYKHLL